MRYDADDIDLPHGSVVAIGTFDGVHVGHRAVLARALATAGELGATAVVAVAGPGPATDLRPADAPPLLTDLPQRMELLAQTGIELCVVVPADAAAAPGAPEDLVRAVAARLRARALVVGEDVAAAVGRAAAAAPAGLGCSVVTVPLVTSGPAAGAVSAEAVRQALARGDVGAAAQLLGRPHEVRGPVGHGDHRGRTIGFPTANVAVPGGIALPANGVYAGWYEEPSGAVHPAAINLGTRPTFYADGGARLLEAHLLDFDGDLYGQHAKVRFAQWLRAELRFATVEALVERMHEDVAATRAATRQ